MVSFYLTFVCRLRFQRFLVNVAGLAVLYSSEFFPLFSLAVVSVNTVTVSALDLAPFQRNAVFGGGGGGYLGFCRTSRASSAVVFAPVSFAVTLCISSYSIFIFCARFKLVNFGIGRFTVAYSSLDFPFFSGRIVEIYLISVRIGRRNPVYSYSVGAITKPWRNYVKYRLGVIIIERNYIIF